MEYMDEILDRINSEGIENVFYEMFCENNMLRLSGFNIDDFEEIYYALFDDDISDLKKASNFVMMANDGDFNERMDIIYYEILDTAYDNYSIARFLTENDRSTWNSIINEYISTRDTHIENIVFNFYKTLQTPVKTF
jgi:hypothetical protein